MEESPQAAMPEEVRARAAAPAGAFTSVPDHSRGPESFLPTAEQASPWAAVAAAGASPYPVRRTLFPGLCPLSAVAAMPWAAQGQFTCRGRAALSLLGVLDR